MAKLMISCQDAAHLVSLKRERDLKISERFALWFHLLVCIVCKRFDLQIEIISKVVHYGFQTRGELKLSDESREKIKKTLSENSKADE